MAGENRNPKSYNNPKLWEGVEDKPKTIFSKTNKQKTTEEEYLECLDNISKHENMETDLNPKSIVEINSDDFDEVFDEDFDEVLDVTKLTDKTSISKPNQLIKNNDLGGSLTFGGGDYYVAKYDKIDPEKITKKHKEDATKLVNKITKFVIEFNDVKLTDDHKQYIKTVAEFQIDNLTDMMYLTEVNRRMINNIIERVNATTAEDYVVLNSYNNLINQHMKLIKELSNTYRSIPNVLKKMRSEVLTNQDIDDQNPNEEIITENYGKTQFNSSKQLLRKMIEERENKKIDMDKTN